MLLVPTEVRQSPIHGVGVFLLAPVKEGDQIWRFDTRVDRIYAEDEILSLPELTRSFIDGYACWHKQFGIWMLCGDNGKYVNHSDKPNMISFGIAFDCDAAARDLPAGAELTSDYRTICDVTLEL